MPRVAANGIELEYDETRPRVYARALYAETAERIATNRKRAL